MILHGPLWSFMVLYGPFTLLDPPTNVRERYIASVSVLVRWTDARVGWEVLSDPARADGMRLEHAYGIRNTELQRRGKTGVPSNVWEISSTHSANIDPPRLLERCSCRVLLKTQHVCTYLNRSEERFISHIPCISRMDGDEGGS